MATWMRSPNIAKSAQPWSPARTITASGLMPAFHGATWSTSWHFWHLSSSASSMLASFYWRQFACHWVKLVRSSSSLTNGAKDGIPTSREISTLPGQLGSTVSSCQLQSCAYSLRKSAVRICLKTVIVQKIICDGPALIYGSIKKHSTHIFKTSSSRQIRNIVLNILCIICGKRGAYNYL